MKEKSVFRKGKLFGVGFNPRIFFMALEREIKRIKAGGGAKILRSILKRV